MEINIQKENIDENTWKNQSFTRHGWTPPLRPQVDLSDEILKFHISYKNQMYQCRVRLYQSSTDIVILVYRSLYIQQQPTTTQGGVQAGNMA